MLTIALIDDKEYGLEQIRERHLGEEFSLEYFSSFHEFKKRGEKFDVVYLDYYLEKDGTTGDTVLEEVKALAGRVVGFSSVRRCSEKLKKLGADAAVVKS